MAKSTSIPLGQCAAPRSRHAKWLLDAPAARDDIRDELRSTLFTRMPSLVASGVVAFQIVAVALYRHPTAAFLAWAIIDAALVAVRLVIVIQVSRWHDKLHESYLIDAFLAGSVLWCLQIGIGGLICMTTGDPVIAILSSLLVMGIVGAMGARNPGAPRHSALLMTVLVVPYTVGCVLFPDPMLKLVLVLAPAYLYGMISINRGLHLDYVAMLTAKRDNMFLAVHDGLTGLPNRHHLDEKLNAAIGCADDASVSLLCLDLDGFKTVNDIHGHASGDAVLREVARRMSDTIPSSMLAARLGGDEFAILARDCSVEDLSAMAHDLILAIGCPISLPNGEGLIGVSIGLATYREDGVNSLGLLSQADQALYEAKRKGRNRFCIYDDERVEPLYPPVQVMVSA